MAHSHHTEKEWVMAGKEMPRNSDGCIRYPTVIARKPHRGDIHPLSKSFLEGMMPRVPLEYLFGLRKIELRPRLSPRIGEPFGCYLIRERVVVLYSLPLEWWLERISQGWREHLTGYRAGVAEADGWVRVVWPGEVELMLWFWDQVFYHELGHHFVEQYKNRNGRVRTRREHEFKAGMHVGRYLNRRYRRLQLQREAGAQQA
jgi:hypothetical protein